MADRRYTINAFTVDLELPALPSASHDRGDAGVRSLEQGTDRLLALFTEHDVRATFFVGSDLPSAAAGLVRRIAAGGHELAVLAPRFTSPLDRLLHLRQEIGRARGDLASITGSGVYGVRLLPLSRGWRSPAMIETLVQEGFVYSSSTLPRYSLSPLLLSTAKRPHRLATPSGEIWELPLTAWRPLGLGVPSLPTHGGPALGLLPAWTFARGVEGMNRHGEPALLRVDAVALSDNAEQHDADGVDRLVKYGPPTETLTKLATIFRIYRFAAVQEAYASRLTTAMTRVRPPRRTSIIRLESNDR